MDSIWTAGHLFGPLFLFRYLEFAAFEYAAILILQLEDIDPTEKIVQVDLVFGGYLGDFMNFFTEEIENLEGVTLIVTAVEFEGNLRYGRVGVEPYHSYRLLPLCRRGGFLLGLRQLRSSCQNQYKEQFLQYGWLQIAIKIEYITKITNPTLKFL